MARRVLKRLLYRLYERQLLTEILGEPLPRHIGLIQDGHRRYSRDVGLATLADGYRIGADKTEEVLTWCAELDIPTVTLWALSTDNLARPAADVADILEVIEAKMAQWIQGGLAQRLGMRIRPIGLLELLPPSALQALRTAEAATRHHQRRLLNVAVGYGGRQEIVDAVKGHLRDCWSRGDRPDEILEALTPGTVDKYLYTYDCPDPDLIIRTSGRCDSPVSCCGRAPIASSISVTSSGLRSARSISCEESGAISAGTGASVDERTSPPGRVSARGRRDGCRQYSRRSVSVRSNGISVCHPRAFRVFDGSPSSTITSDGAKPLQVDPDGDPLRPRAVEIEVEHVLDRPSPEQRL